MCSRVSLFCAALVIFSSMLWTSVESTQRLMCGDNVILIEGGPDQCIKTYNGSGASLHFNITGNCNLFNALNFTSVNRDQWATHFNTCAHNTTFLLTTFLPGGGYSNIDLLTAQCLRSDEGDSPDKCTCKMDCLLKFQFGPFSYIYLHDISCNQSIFQSAISIYKNSSNVQSNFGWRDGYPTCTVDPSSSVSVVSSSPPPPPPSLSSSLPITISTTSSTVMATSNGITTTSTTLLEASPTSTVTSSSTPLCLIGYEITISNDSYCSNNCFTNNNNTHNSSFHQLYTQSCHSSSSPTPSDHLLINFTTEICQSSSNYPSTPLAQVLSLTSTELKCQPGWNISGLNCQCNASTNTSCPFYSSSSSCASHCIINFMNNSSSSIYTLFTGLSDEKRRDLLSNLKNGCNISSAIIDKELMTDCCTTVTTVTNTVESSIGTSSSSTPLTPTTGTNVPIYKDFYFQVGVGAAGGCILLLLISVLFVCLVWKGKRKQRKKFHPSVITPSQGEVGGVMTGKPYPLNSNSDSTLVFSPAVLEPPPVYGKPVMDYTKWKLIFSSYIINYSQISSLESIGEGAFGLVQKGCLTVSQSGRKLQVAVKSMKDASVAEQVEEFMSESAIMLDFDHPNVLKLLGVCFDTEDQLPVIVLPYMANGDLKSFLQSKRRIANGGTPEGLTISLLTRMCLDICQGMEYLSKKKFVHRDLAARNCMIDEDLFVKVADFGLSRDIYSRDYYRLERRAKLPVKWLPPESLHDNIYNEKTDVWSFGVTCWEVFSLGKTPYPALDNADVLDYIDKGIRLGKPKLCPKEMYLTLSQCWDEKPDVRPSFTDLIERIQTIHSNWVGLTASLQLQMEQQLLLEHDERTGSSAEVLIKKRVRGSSSSSVTTPLSPSQRKISTTSNISLTIRPKEASGYIIPSSWQQDTPTDEYSHLTRNKSTSSTKGEIENSLYNSFSSQPSDTQSYSTIGGEWSERMKHRQPSLENFGRTLDRREDGSSNQTPSPLPVFESLYDTSERGINNNNNNSQIEQSLSASLEESNNVARTPDDGEYSSLIHNNYSKNKNIKKRSSSKSSTAPLLTSTSTTASRLDSPEISGEVSGHYYFTLDRPSSVFGEDTDDGSEPEDKRGGAKVASKSSSKSSSPILEAYEMPENTYEIPMSVNYKDNLVQLSSHSPSLLSPLNNNLLLHSNQVPLKQFYVTEEGQL